MPVQTEHHRLEFKAENGYPSACNITIYRFMQLVIAEETGEGRSITNACEVIATEQGRLSCSKALWCRSSPDTVHRALSGDSAPDLWGIV